MARINAWSRGALIALVSDTARDLGMTARFAHFTSWVERVGSDVATPTLIETLMRTIADQDRKIAALEAKLTAVSAEVVAWDSQDMAVSAASAAAAPVGRHAAPEVDETAVKAAPVWLSASRTRVVRRVSAGLGIAPHTIVLAIELAMSLGHTAQDALGAWMIRNGSGQPVTDENRAAATAMGFTV